LLACISGLREQPGSTWGDKETGDAVCVALSVWGGMIFLRERGERANLAKSYDGSV